MRWKETSKERIRRTKIILRRLNAAFPEATTELHHRSALEMLIATILSAQCTDKRVNQVTIPLFKKYHTASDYARTPQLVLEEIIRSTGFYHSKAKNIINCCRMLVDRHNGRVPETMPELLELPGVGRKTANVVLGNYFGKAEGIVVDTHVMRISGRLGLTNQKTPERIEQDLVNVVPKKYWIPISNLLILHGRKTCNARKPDCGHCTIADYCPSADL
jgi:endonuclease III